ncbi:Pyridoxal 5'-phosphate synthase subunit snz1 [Pichia californica]|uniref:pyridoxal 5'-phosphate synthase (glutamine hydrolyzing) n=1 Tax=Pichia californica TaxID=460514 RepID=A0A9P6WKB7_9ASCO|nr:Pyridoxal 5'-phosphate synthase subunit snz1 [[Candida] californica]KAG0688749.1 Pyridoxal 5'-phosphate synthase subunit snz1 [[Candida] californica]
MNSDFELKAGLAQMLKNGVIMDVTTPEEAIIAERAGAVAVMALERVPSDIRRDGGVARMSDPEMIKKIMNSVSIPVMAKVRIGHFVEAEILEELGVDYIDESEVLSVADRFDHIKKNAFKVPFVCGSKDLGETLRRIEEGAAMIRTKGEAGTGDISEAIYHIKLIKKEIYEMMEKFGYLTEPNEELIEFCKEKRVKPETVMLIIKNKGRLPVVNFAAGGVATPADAAICMKLGCEGIFVGSGIFKSENPEAVARAIVNAVNHFSDKTELLKNSTGLGKCMFGINVSSLKEEEKLSKRGW